MKRIAYFCLISLMLFSFLQGAISLPEPEKIQLENGLTIFFLKQKELPLVAFRLLARYAGTAYEPVEGLADLTAQLLLKGTKEKSAEIIAEEIDFLGASLRCEAQEEYMEMYGTSLAENFEKLMSIVSECMLNPAFTPEEFEKERQRRLESIKSIKDNPDEAVYYYFQKAYFGAHPLGHIDIGTQTSLEKTTVKDVQNFYKNSIRLEQVAMAVVGNITLDKLKNLLNSTLARWEKISPPALKPKLPAFPALQAKTCLLIDKPDATQAYFVLGVPGYPMGDKITPSAQVMDTLFGGRFTSWVNTELRIKRGLTYGAYSNFQSWQDGGIFYISSYTQNEKIGEMLDITFGLMVKAKKEGFGAEEIESSRNYILGQFPPSLQSLLAKARAYTTLYFYNLGFGYYGKLLERIGRMNKELVDGAARQFMPGQNYVLVVVGRGDDIRQQLAKFCKFREKKISDPDF